MNVLVVCSNLYQVVAAWSTVSVLGEPNGTVVLRLSKLSPDEKKTWNLFNFFNKPLKKTSY